MSDQYTFQRPKTIAQFHRMLRAVSIGGALVGVLALASEAQATPRCNSKPAVCAMQKADAARRAEMAEAERSAEKPSAAVKSQAAPTPKRCTSKPAVCALQRSSQQQPAPRPVKADPPIVHCTSKPAVCAMQRSNDALRGLTQPSSQKAP